MNVAVIHGPNLNLLGTREPAIYGTTTLAEIDRLIAHEASVLGITVNCAQYNSEGAIIDAIHTAAATVAGIVLNPAAYTHYSFAIRDAIAAVSVPVIEVHITNIHQREEIRRKTVTAEACAGSIAGFREFSYVLALHALHRLHAQKSA